MLQLLGGRSGGGLEEAVVALPWLLWLHTVSRRVMVTWRNIVHLVSYVWQCDGRSVCYRQPLYRVCPYWTVTMTVLDFVDDNGTIDRLGESLDS